MKIKVLLLIFFGFSVLKTHAISLQEDSIYQVNSQWQNRYDKTIKLESLVGKKQIVALMYSHCLTVCPMIVSNIKAIQDTLTPKQQKEIGFVLVSLTPNRDTPKVLNDFALKRGLDDHWLLLSGNDDDVRVLAMTLNIQYMNMADDEVSHANTITVLDEQGKLQFQQVGLNGGPEALIKKIWAK